MTVSLQDSVRDLVNLPYINHNHCSQSETTVVVNTGVGSLTFDHDVPNEESDTSAHTHKFVYEL